MDPDPGKLGRTVIDNLMSGLSTALTPENLLWCFVGVLAGTVIGLLPVWAPAPAWPCCCL